MSAETGWKLVPSIPTSNMLDHANTAAIAANAYVVGKFEDPKAKERVLMTAVYTAMLAASPTPPEAQGESGWISVEDRLPEFIEGQDYSANVLAMIDGHLGVAARLYMDEGWSWANCYGHIDGDAEFDDDYKVTHWMPLPDAPKPLIPSIEQREG